MAETTARDLGRAAAQNLLRTDPLSEASINLIADAVMDAFAPGHRAEVLNEAAAKVWENRTISWDREIEGWKGAHALLLSMATPAAAPSDPGREE